MSNNKASHSFEDMDVVFGDNIAKSYIGFPVSGFVDIEQDVFM